MSTDRVLVVDDEPQILWLVSRFLHKLGYAVEEAGGGEEAILKLRADSFALVLCDLKMPLVDGWQVLEEITRHHPDTLFVLMTAFATIDMTISGMRRGVYDFLTKPLDLNDLTLTMRRAMSHRELLLQNKQLIASLRDKNLILDTLHREEQRKTEQLRQVNAIARQITEILDVDRLIDIAIPQVCRAFHFASLSFGVIDRDQIAFRGPPLDGRREAVQASPFWALTQGGRRPFVRSPDTPSTIIPACDLVFPLQAHDRIVGLWVANWQQDAPLGQDNLPFLESLAGQTAVVLENARLYSLARRADELAFLNRIGQASKQSLNLKESVQSILLCICSGDSSLPPVSAAEICLLDDDQNIEMVFSLIGETFQQGQQPLPGREFVCQVGPQSVWMQRDVISGSLDPVYPLLCSWLGVPLYLGPQLIGVLVLGSSLPDAFGRENGRMLQIAGQQIAMAIENARLFEQVENTQRTISESRSTLLAVFDSILDGIYIIDRRQKILAINRTQAGRVERKYSELVGRPAQEAFPQGQQLIHCIEETLKSGKPVSCTERQQGEGRAWTEWNVHTYPVVGEDGEVNHVVVVVRDVTEQQRLEASLLQSEKLAAIGQLVTGIAHEINNPMTVISTNIQILREEIPPSHPSYESVELIHRAAERASKIVQNLLRFSRAEQFEFMPTDLNLSLQDVVSLVRSQMNKANIEMGLHLQAGLSPIWASPDHLRMIWFNLLLNAHDAIQDAGNSGHIDISSGCEGEAVWVRISDDGMGISPDNMRRIFDPFFTTKEPGRGTGLGLFNCFRTIERHRGRIHVESQEGQGTVFEVWLPIRPD